MTKLLKTPANRRESNVWENAKTGRWHWEVRLMRRDGTEFRKAGSKKTEKEALAARDTAYSDFNENEGKSEGHTVKSWAEHCIANIFPNEHQENSTSVYGYVLTKHAYSLIGNIRLSDLNPTQLQLFFNQLQASTSEAVAVKVRTALSACLTRAVMQGMITTNPASFVRIKKAAKNEVLPDDEEEEERADKRILTEVEQAALLKASKGTLIEPAIWLGLKLGLRLGECLGLSWSSVNLDKGTVRIKQQLKRIPQKGLEIRPPKTRSGIRSLRIPDSLKPFLIEAKSNADENGCQWVCPNRSGGMLDPRRAVELFSQVAAKALIEEKSDGTKVFVNGQKGKPDATHHDCRSTLLSYLANRANNGQGVRPAVLKMIAGHSKIDTTMRYYVRASAEDVFTAMSFIP